jgi:hypothetical protein
MIAANSARFLDITVMLDKNRIEKLYLTNKGLLINLWRKIMSRLVKKRWTIIIIILVLGVIWRIYTDFNGSMIDRIRSKHIVQEYLNAKYLSDKYVVGEISYDFKFNYYVVDVLTRKEEKEFKIIVKNKLRFLEDLRLTDKLSSDFLSGVTNIVRETAPSVEKVSGQIYPLIIIQEDFQSGILRKDTFWIDLHNEKGEITKEDFADVSNNILAWMKEQNFMINQVYFNYSSEETEKTYVIDIKEENIYTSRDELLGLIKEESGLKIQH